MVPALAREFPAPRTRALSMYDFARGQSRAGRLPCLFLNDEARYQHEIHR